jgi:mRNA-degrading endonuclease toxin of MazEF toxin-antitoxin module
MKSKFGPYKGSEQNGGRPIYVIKKKVKGKTVTTSVNKARADFEEKQARHYQRRQM